MQVLETYNHFNMLRSLTSQWCSGSTTASKTVSEGSIPSWFAKTKGEQMSHSDMDITRENIRQEGIGVGEFKGLTGQALEDFADHYLDDAWEKLPDYSVYKD